MVVKECGDPRCPNWMVELRKRFCSYECYNRFHARANKRRKREAKRHGVSERV